MKLERVLAWILIIVLIVTVIVLLFKNDSSEQSIEHHKRRAERAELQRDSTESHLIKIQDQLEVLEHLLALSNLATEKSKERANEADRKLREIVKVTTKTDHERDSILRALYPELY